MDIHSSKTSRKIYKSELVEVKINAGANTDKIQLPDFQNLRNVHLMGIETYYDVDFPISPLTKTALPDVDLFRSIFLSLQTYDGKVFQWYGPVSRFHTLLNGQLAENFPNEFQGQKISWTKSFITIADPSLIPPDKQTAFVFEVFYKESAAKERQSTKRGLKQQK